MNVTSSGRILWAFWCGLTIDESGPEPALYSWTAKRKTCFKDIPWTIKVHGKCERHGSSVHCKNMNKRPPNDRLEHSSPVTGIAGFQVTRTGKTSCEGVHKDVFCLDTRSRTRVASPRLHRNSFACRMSAIACSPVLVESAECCLHLDWLSCALGT